MKIDRYKEVILPDGAQVNLDAEETVLQVEVRAGVPVRVFYRCPCGCGDNVGLPLVHENNQRGDVPGAKWDFHLHGHLIHPSVRHLAGCRSHYFIHADGTVEWC